MNIELLDLPRTKVYKVYSTWVKIGLDWLFSSFLRREDRLQASSPCERMNGMCSAGDSESKSIPQSLRVTSKI